MSESSINKFAVVVPAAGVGKRMQSNIPKQYLLLQGKTVLEQTVDTLLAHPLIDRVIVAIHQDDPYYPTLPLSSHSQVIRVKGGEERMDSVLSGLRYLSQHHPHEYAWVLVHDAARPCLHHDDISALIQHCLQHHTGGILATPVTDTVKQVQQKVDSDCTHQIEHTLDRRLLWRALTPQMFPLQELTSALENGILYKEKITDEASAIEYAGGRALLIQGRSDNIKITQPEDLSLAEFFLTRFSQNQTEG